MRHRVILMEGLCGAGKTTLGERLCRDLNEQGVPARFFDEGAADHPVSLNSHAYFGGAEYRVFLARYPEYAEALEAASVFEDEYVLVPYGENTVFAAESELTAELERYELCYTNAACVSLPDFSRAVRRQWERFAVAYKEKEPVTVLDGVFFQHPVHDLIRHFGAGEPQVASHIMAVGEVIRGLDPAIFYLSHRDTKRRLLEVGAVRGKSHYAREDFLTFMLNRQVLELRIMQSLPFEKHIIWCDGLDWESPLERIKKEVIPP